MTARTSAALKAQFRDRDPADHNDDVVDTIHAPTSAVTFAGAATFTGAATFNGSTTASGTFTASQPIVLSQGLDQSDFVQVWDDFIQQTLTEADGPWIENSGASGTAVDPAISAQAGGVVRLTTGDDDGTFAQDGSQIIAHLPCQAASGALFMEARLHINTAITNASVNVGFTDVTTLEEPFSISGTAYTSTASDAVVFVYDTDATTDQWHCCAVDTNVDDTGCAASGVAPVADTYQVLRIEVSIGGGTCWFYINDTLRRTLSGGGVTPNVNLYPTVTACGDGTASRTVDIDYITFGHTR